MIKLLKEYTKVIGYTFTGLVFGAAFFLLFINFYHYKDISTTLVKNDEDMQKMQQDVNNKLSEVKNITSSFNPNVYNGPKERVMLMTINSKLQLCVKEFEDEDLNKMLNKKEMSITDVYRFQNLYQSKIVNGCIVTQLYDLTVTGNEAKYQDADLAKIAPFLKLNADNIRKDNDYVSKVLLNNGSFFFSSENSKSNMFEMTRDSYYEVNHSYLESVDLLLEFSRWFKGIV